MKRRDFLRKLPLVAGAPLMLSGLPMRVLGQDTLLGRAARDTLNGRVLVLIQLHGGNDGLNTLVPIDQYADYYALRPSIALPYQGLRKYITLDNLQPSEKQLGIHPDMTAFKALYDEGKVAIIQNVGYNNLNQSHFRSRDIWFMGGDYDEYRSSGWMGRYLDHNYPGYPEEWPKDWMQDPMAIEIGTGMSLAFHRDTGIPISIAIDDPEQFYNLITTTGAEPPTSVADSYYGDELRYILDIDKQSNRYADRLKEVFDAGSNSPGVAYPSVYPYSAPDGYYRNGLSSQLKLIARLLAGGCGTRIFLARLGGFDTHAGQVQAFDASMGRHGALLYHLSSAMRAFQNDLKGLGLEDRVMTLTFSEFGRRAYSNGSFGTDHGSAAPMFAFGKCVMPGVVGNNPNLSDLDGGGNLKHTYDYRQVFTTVLQDWMGANHDTLVATELDAFENQKLDIVACKAVLGTQQNEFVDARFDLRSCYPNPTSGTVTFKFYINNELDLSLKLYTMSGDLLTTVYEGRKGAGVHEISYDVSSLLPGSYIYQLSSGSKSVGKVLVKQ